MDVGMAHGDALSGTFWGHGFPGTVFIVWAGYWAALAILQGGTRGGARPLEPSRTAPVLKVVLAVVGVWIEIPGEGWYPQDVMMSWQHCAMYAAFGLSGVVDLLARAGRLSAGSTFVAYSAGMANAGLLFFGHSGHGGVEGTVHALLALVFFTAGAVALVEVVRPSSGLAWGRIGTQLLLGSWFMVGAWIIYRSGWDLTDGVRQGWTYTLFSLSAAGAATVTLAACLAAGVRTNA